MFAVHMEFVIIMPLCVYNRHNLLKIYIFGKRIEGNNFSPKVQRYGLNNLLSVNRFKQQSQSLIKYCDTYTTLFSLTHLSLEE